MSIRPLSAQLRPLTPSSKQRPLTATPSTSGTGNDSPSVFEELEEVDEREDKEQELKRAKEAERQRLSRECIVSTRTRDGLARATFGSQYTSHVDGRYQGRDLQTGFRTPHGVDYISVGGQVATHSGSDIQRVINPDFNPKTKPLEKIQMTLGQTYEPAGSYKTDYLQVALLRLLEQTPKRQLILTVSTKTIGAEMFVAMSDNHPYPAADKCDWVFGIDVMKKLGVLPETEKQWTFTIEPNDPVYLKAVNKNITVALRSSYGFIEYRFRAVTQTTLAVPAAAARSPAGRNPAGVEKHQLDSAQEFRAFKVGMGQSYALAQRARGGHFVSQELETRTHPSELLAKAPQQKPRRQSVARTSSAGAGTGKDAAADEKLSLVGSLRKSLDVLGAEEALGGGHPWLRGGGRNSAGTLMGVTLGRGESDVSAGMTDATSFSRASSSGLTARRLSKVLKAPVEVKAGHRTDGKPFKIPAAMRLQLAVEEVRAEREASKSGHSKRKQSGSGFAHTGPGPGNGTRNSVSLEHDMRVAMAERLKTLKQRPASSSEARNVAFSPHDTQGSRRPSSTTGIRQDQRLSFDSDGMLDASGEGG
ncbi:hypothetical protein T484DRAFT_1900360, partial [Baffinella frigidus]